MSLLLISGSAEAGKSTMADYLKRNYLNYVEYALGDKLKSLTFEILKLFNVPIDNLSDLHDVKTKMRYRQYLQQIGTECCRKVFGDNFWCEMIDKEITRDLNKGKNVIISDVRFINEQKYFIEQYTGSAVIHRIMIKRTDGIGSNLTSDQKKHSSESQISQLKCDYVIYNDMTNKYFDEIDDIMKVIHKVEDKECKPKCKVESDYYNDEESDHINSDVGVKLIKSAVDVFDDESVSVDSESENVDDVKVNDIKPVNAHVNVEPTCTKPQCKPQCKHQHIPQPSSQSSPLSPLPSFTPTTLSSSPCTNTSTVSSYTLGKIGEHDVLRIINSVRPKFETSLVSSTGHLADIHSLDHKNHIKYIFEIKYKQYITREDVAKFEKDVESIQSAEHAPTRVIGIFISLNSDTIPVIGKLSISKSKIYLTKEYFSESTLEILFRLIETYYKLLSTTNENSSTAQKPTYVKYEIPPNVLELLIKLRAEYSSLTREMELYTSMKNNTEHNLTAIQELIGKLVLKEQFITFINNEFSDILPVLNDTLIVSEEEKMSDYIKSHSKSTIKKKDLLTLFPTMKTKIGSMKLNDLIDEYKNKD